MLGAGTRGGACSWFMLCLTPAQSLASWQMQPWRWLTCCSTCCPPPCTTASSSTQDQLTGRERVPSWFLGGQACKWGVCSCHPLTTTLLLPEGTGCHRREVQGRQWPGWGWGWTPLTSGRLEMKRSSQIKHLCLGWDYMPPPKRSVETPKPKNLQTGPYLEIGPLQT